MREFGNLGIGGLRNWGIGGGLGDWGIGELGHRAWGMGHGEEGVGRGEERGDLGILGLKD